MPNEKRSLRLIEEEGYRAARAGESKSMHLFYTRDERMAFEAGYYKGTIESNREREAKGMYTAKAGLYTKGRLKTGEMNRTEAAYRDHLES